MQERAKHQHLPNADSLSILAAMILLSYALAHFIQIPTREFGIQLPGIYISIEPNVYTFTALLVAGMTASGTHKLLRDHPELGSQRTIGHWLLPALTAWVIGLPLFQLPLSPTWWLGFGIGAVLLILVILAEYISVDPDDERYLPAATGLIAISFALFLALAIALRISGSRLIFIVPVLSFAAGLVSLRTLNLRIPGQWQYTSAVVVMLVTGQFAAGLHYWPLTPIAYGMVLLGPAYSLTSLLGSLTEGDSVRKAIIEPLVILLLVWLAAFWIQ